MAQAGTVHNIRIAPEHHSDLAAYLSNFQSMGQARTRKIIGTGNEHLGFCTKAAEGGRMDDTRPVTLEFCTVPGFRRFRSPPFLIKLGIPFAAHRFLGIKKDAVSPAAVDPLLSSIRCHIPHFSIISLSVFYGLYFALNSPAYHKGNSVPLRRIYLLLEVSRFL